MGFSLRWNLFLEFFVMRSEIVMLNSSGVPGVADNMSCRIECWFQSALESVFRVLSDALRDSDVELLRSTTCS